jgi:hypothetical protein
MRFEAYAPRLERFGDVGSLPLTDRSDPLAAPRESTKVRPKALGDWKISIIF